MNLIDEFEQKLDESLSIYCDTIKLIDHLINEKRNSQEVILLVCSRLDSLANLAIHKSATQKQSFTKFISHYSGDKKIFNSISVGDLYWYLLHYGDIADGGLIEIPGRIKRIGDESEDFLHFVEKSTIPITGKAVQQLSFRVSRLLEKNFRVKPKQRITKKYITSQNEVKKLIEKEFKIPEPSQILNSIEPLLERFKIGSILYRRFRCGVIHGFKVPLNERDFFNKKSPFHGVFATIQGPVFNIEFPALYLRNLLEKSLHAYTQELKSNKKIPANLYFEIYTIDDIFNEDLMDFLDENTLEEFEDVKWRLKNY